MRFERLAIPHGGEVTPQLDNVRDITFDHVGIFSATHGLRTNNTTGTTFAHCRFLGGLPDWLFRSDLKSGYHYLRGGTVVGNNVGAQTSRALLLGAADDTGTRIHHSEFRNGHDLYLVGSHVEFHNRIDNLNDEALLLDAYASRDVRIYQKVITRSLSALSFADDAPGGPCYIYRNLIDLRQPTAGNRARHEGGARAWRYGHLYKSNPPDGPWELFQNTLLVSSQPKEFKADFTHYRDVRGTSQHRAVNNVFVSVSRPDAPRRPVAVTDGNAYFRAGALSTDPDPCLNLPSGQSFVDLAQLKSTALIDQSREWYPPGYETSSMEGDPGFRRLRAAGAARPTHDLRLILGGPAATAGVPLPVRSPGSTRGTWSAARASGPIRPTTGDCASESTAGACFRASNRRVPRHVHSTPSARGGGGLAHELRQDRFGPGGEERALVRAICCTNSSSLPASALLVQGRGVRGEVRAHRRRAGRRLIGRVTNTSRRVDRGDRCADDRGVTVADGRT